MALHEPTTTPTDVIHVRDLGLCDYVPVWRAMQSYSSGRTAHAADRFWQVQHAPVYTLGMNGKSEHIRAPGTIPVVRSDRGGQATYHGPGQLVLYTLVDLARRRIGIREWVTHLEQAVIDLLAAHGVTGTRRDRAPGVYVDGAKLAALGLRVRRGCCYHGLSLNVQMDLAPFTRIHPCGARDLPVTQLADLGIALSVPEAGAQLAEILAARIGARTRAETGAFAPPAA